MRTQNNIPPARTQQHLIRGYEFALIKGRRYLAGRPFTTGRCNEKFDVTITDITDGFSYNATPVARVPGLTYAAANALLDAFNSGESTFEGRLIV